MTEWYRKKTWTKSDEEQYFAKLKKARIHGRAQYLRIQAVELIETNQPKLLDVAENLLNKLLIEYPEARTETSSAFNLLGDIYKLRENYSLAIEFYRKSLDFEKVFPNVITSSYLNYSELVIKTRQKDLYGIVEKMLEDRLEQEIFPISKYRMCLILSVINHQYGNLDRAKYYEHLAEENASAKTSGLRYHQHLGLVKSPS